MKHKIEIAPNIAIYIDGERVIGSKPHGLFLTTEMIVSDEDLKRLSNRCLKVIAKQTEPQACRNCKWSQTVCRLGDSPPCHSYEPKTEPNADNLSPLDKDTNVRSKDCETCKYKDHNWWSNKCDPCCRGNSNYESIKAFQDLYGIKAEPPTLKEMVEPQTEREGE